VSSSPTPTPHDSDDLATLFALRTGSCAPSVTVTEGGHERSLASSALPGDDFYEEDDEEVDLAKLCSAFCHLERSTGHTSTGESSMVIESPMGTRLAPSPAPASSISKSPSPHEEGSLRTPPSGAHISRGDPLWEFGRTCTGGGTRSCAVPPRRPSATATFDDNALEHFASGSCLGGSRSLMPPVSPPQGENQIHVVPEPSRPDNDAQRLDAWIQRVIAKGGDRGLLHNTPDNTHARSKSPLIPPHPVVGCTVSPLEESRSETMKDIKEKERKIQDGTDVTFELEVQLSGDVLGTLKVSSDESLESTCKAFVTEHHLRPIFLAPLETHVELMIHMLKKRDTVDVIDLI